MASSMTILTVVSLLACASAITLRGGDSLDAQMQPEVVAKTLKGVEDKWKEQAAAFIECSEKEGQDCSDDQVEFGKSCATVVGAIVQGSSGDKVVAKDYMGNVCGQSLLSGWHQQHCMGLKVALDLAMSADSYQNRESFTSTKMCNKFWGEFVAEEKKRFVREEAERKAAEKKAEEEAAIKAKADAAKAAKDKEEAEKAAQVAKEAAEKKAAADAAAKKIAEAVRVKAEAAKKAEEAQAKAAEAAANLAKKKAEAEEFAKKAQEKMAEAEKAEEEHKKAQANLAGHDAAPVVAAVAKKEEAAPVVPAVAKKEEAAPVVAVVAKKEEAAPVVAAVAKKEEAAPVKPAVPAAPVKEAAAPVKPAFLEQDPCAGCTEGLAQAYQTCASKHGNPCAETNAAGLVTSGPGTKKDIGCCMKKEKHDRCLKCSGMDCAHGTCKVNKKYNNERTIGEGPLDDKKAMKKAGWGK